MPQSGGMRMNWFRYVKFRARVLGGLGTVLAAVPLSLIALGAAPSSAAGADWSSYLHDNGHSSYNAAATSITPATLGNLQPVWRWLVPPSPNGGRRSFWRRRPSTTARCTLARRTGTS